MTFAERLRFYREKANLSQKELCEKMDISFSTYNNYETRGYEPKIDILIKLANALGIDVNTLVGFQQNEKDALLNVLRAADIPFKSDPDDENALFVKNISNQDSIYYMESAHITFTDLKMLIIGTQKDITELTAPIFRRVLQDNIRLFKIDTPADPKDVYVWRDSKEADNNIAANNLPGHTET